MNKNYLPIYFAIAVTFGILIGYFFNGNSSRFRKTSANEQKVKRLINFIQQDYVDDVDTDQLLDGAIAEMLTKLDPHSVYIPKENLQAVTESMQGNFVGIGVQFRLINDSITVIHPMEGGPSIKKGILAGDRILMADKDTLYGKRLRNREILKRLKGAPNSEVNLQVYRKSNDSLFNITIGRSKINIKSVDVAYMLNDSIGYIKLDRFAQNTYREFKTSLDDLLAKGMTDLVLDLRGNGGGFIHIANKIVDEFLEDDKLIVFTKNNGGEVVESFATERGDFEEGGLYVLIDENSASASEIVAGALQDNDKGTIIGRRSFGKGLVQEEMDLGDGSAVRLTTARYYTPTGRSIQKPYNKNGLELKDPNALQNSINYGDEVESRYRNGELFSKDSIKLIDSLQYKTPKGKIVYGGGGIVPDVFVAIDTTAYLPAIFFTPMNDFAFNYVDNHRDELNKLSFDEFVNEFDKDRKISDRFFDEVKDIRTSMQTKEKLRKLLKINIARELFNDEGWYRLNHLDDKMIKQVFELEKK
ncbi:S41 family peptidase [uncultured Tenacibaculum sp.]|uniref:S41 family peptidase n=1 Tax=uncultured Tenacibaculum sp. TaxID=174713 RepID=UPI00261815B3|nr:S41 family peptidase [uncultured Tenacibaculum sp.]